MSALHAALVKAQAEFPAAPKSSRNTHFHSSFANLPTVVETVRPILAAHGLAFVQTFDAAEDAVTVRTIIIHESGETLDCGPLRLRPVKGDPQAAGSAITYARRYSLMAALGIVADDDDDGNAASHGGLSGDQIEALNAEITRTGTDVKALMKWATTKEATSLVGFPPSKYDAALGMLKAKPGRGES